MTANKPKNGIGKVHHCHHKSLYSVLLKFSSIFKSILPSMLYLLRSLPQVSEWNFWRHFLTPSCLYIPYSFILLGIIPLTLQGGECYLWSSSMCNLFHSLDNFLLFLTQIFVWNALFSNSLSKKKVFCFVKIRCISYFTEINEVFKYWFTKSWGQHYFVWYLKHILQTSRSEL